MSFDVAWTFSIRSLAGKHDCCLMSWMILPPSTVITLSAKLSRFTMNSQHFTIIMAQDHTIMCGQYDGIVLAANDSTTSKQARRHIVDGTCVHATEDIIEQDDPFARVYRARQSLKLIFSPSKTKFQGDMLTILCFCPPLTLKPLLPRRVWSPSSSACRSASKPHAVSTVSYHCAS